MKRSLDPHIVYADARFFLDYIGGAAAVDFFENSIDSLHRAAEARQQMLDPDVRSEVCDALLAYNRQLDASPEALARIAQLRNPDALCVLGGQQAGFLGGPVFVLYKIASIIRVASWLSERLAVPVVPAFWLATEDHDFSEINHIRWLNDEDALQTVSFDWDDRGHPLERLPITDAVRSAFEEAIRRMPSSSAFDPALFAPASEDTYSLWHARLWSRLFAASGLVLVEPRVVRPLASPFFRAVRTQAEGIRCDLEEGAAQFPLHGYPVPLDPERSGRLFVLPEGGRRRRIQPTDPLDGMELSADAALRPLLADSLFPTIANILGPSELAYHGMLLPMYRRLGIPQPLAIPRFGGTIIDRQDADVLDAARMEVGDALDPAFNASETARRWSSPELQADFSQARTRLEKALLPLREAVGRIDPGLEARWHQALDQSKHQLDRLEDRVVRAELARRGISVKRLAGLQSRLLPTGRPQERVLATMSIVARYGVEWIRDLIVRGEPDRFEHQLIVLGEIDG
jgi:bacillithiol synthase